MRSAHSKSLTDAAMKAIIKILKHLKRRLNSLFHQAPSQRQVQNWRRDWETQ